MCIHLSPRPAPDVCARGYVCVCVRWKHHTPINPPPSFLMYVRAFKKVALMLEARARARRVLPVPGGLFLLGVCVRER